MKASTQSGSHTYYLNWEVQQAARKIIRDIMLVKPGETILITSDTTKPLPVQPWKPVHIQSLCSFRQAWNRQL